MCNILPYHGSREIVSKPSYGKVKPYNDSAAISTAPKANKDLFLDEKIGELGFYVA